MAKNYWYSSASLSYCLSGLQEESMKQEMGKACRNDLLCSFAPRNNRHNVVAQSDTDERI